MNKQDILNKIGKLAEKATVIERKRLIEIPFHRLEDFEKDGKVLADAGFTQGIMSYYINYEAESEVEAPSLKESYAQMNEAEQIKADLAWVELGGWLSNEKLARLREAGHKI